MLEGDEIELVEAAISGSSSAFRQLVEHNYMLVYRISYKYCGQREDAEDITQEVFAKLGRVIDKFKQESSFKTWLYTITANAARDHLRKNKNKRSKETLFEESFDAESADEPQDEVLYKKQVFQSLGKLPGKLREAIMLVYSEGLSHAEAGKILGCSEGTVSWRVHEAKKKLLNIKEKVKLMISWLF